MKRIALSIAAFLGVQILVAYIMWMGGFNFDQRNLGTGYVALIGVLIGSGAAALVYDRSN